MALKYKTVRKNKGIIQNGKNKGRLKKGYRYLPKSLYDDYLGGKKGFNPKFDTYEKMLNHSKLMHSSKLQPILPGSKPTIKSVEHKSST